MDLMQMLQQFISQYPALATVFVVIGALRVFLKPFFTLLQEVVNFTPSTRDNEILDGVMNSAAYKWLAYALDWLGSVKLPQASQK